MEPGDRIAYEVGERFDCPVHQIDWLSARAEAVALWEQIHRVHAQASLEYSAPGDTFRVF